MSRNRKVLAFGPVGAAALVMAVAVVLLPNAAQATTTLGAQAAMSGRYNQRWSRG